MTFVGCAIQFDDAPLTPPSNTARVMRGTVEINIPGLEIVRGMMSSRFWLPSNNLSPFFKDGNEQDQSYVRLGTQDNSSINENNFSNEDPSFKKYLRRN